MLRILGAVLLGYAVTFLVVFVTFSGAYLLMGADRAFRTETFEASGLWLAVSFLFGFIAAVAGGAAAFKLGRDRSGPWVLAGLVLVLGLGSMLVQPPREINAVRTGPVGNMEAMQKAQQPRWVMLINPIVAAGGILLGARLVSEPRPPLS